MATTSDAIYDTALMILQGLLANERYSQDDVSTKAAVDKAFELADYFLVLLAAHS